MAASAVDMALDMALRLWRVEVVLAVQKLLSLGSTYRVRYSLPRALLDDLKLQFFGLRITAVVNSHVFQVTEAQNDPPSFPMEFKDEAAGESTDSDTRSSICSIDVGDYLVGMGDDDFLVCPRSLEQLQQDVAAVGVEAAARGDKTVVLRFVRMGAFVRDDPSVGRTPGNVLSVLDELKATCDKLLTRYEALVAENGAAVEELRSTKELLKYVKIMGCETRKTLMEDPNFKLAAKFREWYADIKRDAEENVAAANVTEVQQPEDEDEEDEAVMASPRLPANDGSSSTSPSQPSLTPILRRTSLPRTASKKRVRFAMDVRPKKRVTFAPDVKLHDGASDPSQLEIAGVDESRAYLRALFGRNLDIVRSLQEMAPLQIMVDQEVRLAAGLKVQGELRELAACGT